VGFGEEPSQLAYVVVYTELDKVTVCVTVEMTGAGGEVKVDAAEEVDEVLPPNAKAAARNLSKVLPEEGALAENTIPLWQCGGGPGCAQ